MIPPGADPDQVISRYEVGGGRESPFYADHLEHWTARFTRGDDRAALHAVFVALCRELGELHAGERARYGAERRLLSHVNAEGEPAYAGVYRDALVLLSIAACLRAGPDAQPILDGVVRGDPLHELLAGQISGVRAPAGDAAFPSRFPALYEAYAAPAEQRPALLASYLREFREVLAEDLDLAEEPGLWCFEVAGLVAALDVDDATFAADPCYPAALVRWFREGGGSRAEVREDPALSPAPPAPAEVRWPAGAAGVDRDALARLLSLLANGAARPVAAATQAFAAQLTRAVTEEGADEATAQRWAMQDAIHELGRRRAVISLDWKGRNEVAAACRALSNVPWARAFRWRPRPEDRVPEGLAAVAAFAGEHGYRLVEIDTESDSHQAAVTPADRADELVAQIASFGLRAWVTP